jgi:hypothetical protein
MISDMNMGYHLKVRTVVADKQKYKDVAKLAMPRTIKCLRTRKKCFAENGELIILI